MANDVTTPAKTTEEPSLRFADPPLSIRYLLGVATPPGPKVLVDEHGSIWLHPEVVAALVRTGRWDIDRFSITTSPEPPV